MIKKTNQKRFTQAEAKVIGEKLGISWKDFDVKQFCFGLNAELADGIYNPLTNFATDDPILVGKVVRSHLNETPDYYTQWAEMEKSAAVDHGNKRRTGAESVSAEVESMPG